MSTPVVAVGAAAFGFYLYVKAAASKSGGSGGIPLPVETHSRTEGAPTTWAETVYLFREALRYVYNETLARWHAVDLFFGLAYLSRRESSEYPAADIAAAGRPVCEGLRHAEAAALLSELRTLRRLMVFCQGLRHHGAEAQRRHWSSLLDTVDGDVLLHSPTAGVLRPAFAILRDRTSRSLILAVRGTHSRQDMFTSLIGAVKPHHVVTPNGAVLGWAHLGMLAAARWVLSQTKYRLISALAQHPDHQLLIVGHSMGGGTAALITMMVREKVPELASARCYAFACPAVMTRDLAAACSDAVTTLVHGADIVPTFSIGSVDALREEVTASSWFADFQADTRQRLYSAVTGAMARATLAGGETLVAGCSGAGRWTAQNILAPASQPFRSCYGNAAGACRPRRGGGAGGRAAFGALPRLIGLNGASGTARPDDAAVIESEPLLVSPGGLAGRRRPGALGPGGARPAAGSPDPWRHLRERESSLGFTSADGTGGVNSMAGGGPGDPLAPSASVLEDALQRCLAAVEAGELGPDGSAVGVLAAPPTAETFDRGGGGGGGGPGGGFSRSGRPTAPDKKDDDRGAHPTPTAAPEGAPNAPAAVVGGPVPVGQASAATLRRRGWTWQVLGGGDGGGGGGAGGGSGGWVLEGGGVAGNMVGYVGRTGQLVGQAAGSLLRGGGAVFQACRAPSMPGQPKGTSGGRPTPTGWLAELPGPAAFGRIGSLGGRHNAVGGAPGEDGGAAGDASDADSSQDPDLDDADPCGDDDGGGGGDGGGELDRPAVRGSISAVVATVVTADTDAGSAAARAEASAAEALLREANAANGDGRPRGDGGRGARGFPGSVEEGDALVEALGQAGGGASPPPRRGGGGGPGLGAGGGDSRSGSPSRQGSPARGAGAEDGEGRDPRLVRRQMYPAGRILHLMPTAVVRAAHGQADDTAEGAAPQQQHQQQQAGQPRASTPGQGLGAGGYLLLEVERREVYGRLRLCRAMVRDHFLPGYLRGLDSVAARLEAQLAAPDGM